MMNCRLEARKLGYHTIKFEQIPLLVNIFDLEKIQYKCIPNAEQTPQGQTKFVQTANICAEFVCPHKYTPKSVFDQWLS